jgi:hypothetical protein
MFATERLQSPSNYSVDIFVHRDVEWASCRVKPRPGNNIGWWRLTIADQNGGSALRTIITVTAVIAGASLAGFGSVLAAQDRYTLKVPDGLTFFRLQRTMTPGRPVTGRDCPRARGSHGNVFVSLVQAHEPRDQRITFRCPFRDGGIATATVSALWG